MSIANLITRTFTGAAAAAVLAFGFSAGAAAADKVIRIGVTPVPHADIVNFIKPQLEKEGVKLEAQSRFGFEGLGCQLLPDDSLS